MTTGTVGKTTLKKDSPLTRYTAIKTTTKTTMKTTTKTTMKTMMKKMFPMTSSTASTPTVISLPTTIAYSATSHLPMTTASSITFHF